MADPLFVLLVLLLIAVAGGLFLIAVDCTVRAARWLVRGIVGAWRAFWREPDWRKPE